MALAVLAAAVLAQAGPAQASPRLYDMRPVLSAAHPFEPGAKSREGAADEAASKEKTKRRPFSELHWTELFGPCNGNCAVSLGVGRFTKTDMKPMFGFNGFIPVWDYEWHHRGGQTSYLVSATASRRLATILWYVDVEPEIGIGQRIGFENDTEFWMAVYFRWTLFPWNHLIKTTIAVSTGLNVATGLRGDESPDAPTSHVLHYFSPELTLALPKYDQYEVLVRWHHRSGGAAIVESVSDALFNGVDGESTFFTVGLRHRF